MPIIEQMITETDTFWKYLVVLFANSASIVFAWSTTIFCLWFEREYQLAPGSIGPLAGYIGWAVIAGGIAFALWKVRPPSLIAVGISLAAFALWLLGERNILETFGCAFKAFCPESAN